VGCGEIVTEHLRELGHFTNFTARTLLPVLLAFWRPREWLKPFYGVVIGALPLAIVLGVTLGAVIWMQTRGILERTAGATDLLPTVLAVAVLLELAPIGAGLIVASRTGASLGAELAAMRVTEQIEALELLGVSPLRRLVAPRVIACIFAVPLLHILTATLAIGSGYLAESLTGQTTWLRYQTAVLAELRLHEVLPALVKTFVFGGLIGIAGCYVGLTAPTGSEGVGHAATKSVVICSLLVLVADVVLVAIAR
jgi:phospholipid/cholesterol/gamma-HCH transport system permease protein